MKKKAFLKLDSSQLRMEIHEKQMATATVSVTHWLLPREIFQNAVPGKPYQTQNGQT